MQKYMNTSVKEVMSCFPAVADILNEYSIGCVTCDIGTCLLKDVVGIHHLPEDLEAELMCRIEKAIYPERDVKIPEIKRAPRKTVPAEISYSPPMKKLVDEHTLIKRWIALIPEIVETFDIDSEEDRRLIENGVDFIRNYADRFHHAKEEDILFKYFDEDLEIIRTMLEVHDIARAHVAAMVEGLKNRDRSSVNEHLAAYGELLTDHIQKEDEILYPWIDLNLSTKQVGELYSRFMGVERKDGEAVQDKYGDFVRDTEKKYAKVTK